jgi:hypothetical protein
MGLGGDDGDRVFQIVLAERLNRADSRCRIADDDVSHAFISNPFLKNQGLVWTMNYADRRFLSVA